MLNVYHYIDGVIAAPSVVRSWRDQHGWDNTVGRDEKLEDGLWIVHWSVK